RPSQDPLRFPFRPGSHGWRARALSNRASLNQLQYPHSAAQAAKTDVGWSHSRERYTSARELVSYRGGLKRFRLDDKETFQYLSESQRAGYVSAALANLTWDPAPPGRPPRARAPNLWCPPRPRACPAGTAAPGQNAAPPRPGSAGWPGHRRKRSPPPAPAAP